MRHRPCFSGLWEIQLSLNCPSCKQSLIHIASIRPINLWVHQVALWWYPYFCFLQVPYQWWVDIWPCLFRNSVRGHMVKSLLDNISISFTQRKEWKWIYYFTGLKQNEFGFIWNSDKTNFGTRVIINHAFHKNKRINDEGGQNNPK